MIKKHLKILTVTSLAILLPILVGVLLWDQLPQQLPIHWNMAGEIDDWCSKPFAVFGMPAILLAVQFVAVLAMEVDPKKKNHTDKMKQLSFWLVPVVSIALSAITYSTAMGMEAPIEMCTPLLMGMLFVIVGNYLPKCKQNYTVGIKISWTLNSEENWNKTHRLAGWLWVVCGLLIMLSAFFSTLWVMLAAPLVMVLIPIIYSYLLYRKGI